MFDFILAGKVCKINTLVCYRVSCYANTLWPYSMTSIAPDIGKV